MALNVKVDRNKAQDPNQVWIPIADSPQYAAPAPAKGPPPQGIDKTEGR